jgi:hypothetical protein
VEFFATPRPRWESLHDLQGLVELWRITGQAPYREAFIHHWRSIARWDRHNTGGFSSGEQATGNAYAPAAIETCCTIAWMALSLDMLRLTGEARVADELELATLNGALGAQHPSGRWWTYNTPMDGVREASAHAIVFQARAGTPELNCCSVNGPRALGMLGEWAVMGGHNGLVVNWLGPAEYAVKLSDGTPVRLRCETDFPLSGHLQWTIWPAHAAGAGPRHFAIQFRIPAWAGKASAKLDGQPWRAVRPGAYFECEHDWKNGDTVELDFELPVRFVPGDREAAGKVSLYRGPILLAYDQRFNDFDEAELPLVSLSRLGEARVLSQPAGPREHVLAPWLLVELPGRGNRLLRLCDFASAGASGTRYRSWLAATNPPPPPPVTRVPADGATIGAGNTVFRWTTRTNALLTDYRLVISPSPEISEPVVELPNLKRPRLVLDGLAKQRLKSDGWYYWRIIARGPHGETPSVEPAARFRFDPAQPPSAETPEIEIGPDGLVVKASLRGAAQPEFGRLKRASAFGIANGPDGRAGGAIQLNGLDQMLVYELPEEWAEDFSVSVWVRLTAPPPPVRPGRGLGQVFSAWAAGMDDPLRLTMEDGKLFARMEAQQAYSTQGVPLGAGEWHHLAAIKSGPLLALFVDGRRHEQVAVPRSISTTARTCALGGNPNFSGNECLAAQFAGFSLWFRALSDEEVQVQAKSLAK